MEADTPFLFLKYNTDGRAGASAEQVLSCGSMDAFTPRERGLCLSFGCSCRDCL